MAETKFPTNVALAKIIYRLLINPRGWRVDDLMGELQIKPRTYRKYRKLMQEYFNYMLDSKGTSKIVEIKDGEAKYLQIAQIKEGNQDQIIPHVISLYLGRSMLEFLKETEIFDYVDDFYKGVIRSAKDKSFIANFFQNIDRMLYVMPFAPKDYSAKSDVIGDLLRGIFYRKKIAMDYCALESDKCKTHEVDPYTLLLHKNGLYLIGRITWSTGPVTFAVDRIESVKTLKERFEYPRDYSPEKYTEGSFGIYKEGKKQKVELIFKNEKWLKRYLKERSWHKTQKFTDMRDGRLRMTFTVNSMVEVWPWIRSFGEDVEVVKPIWKIY